jgi:hypothetical protein
VEAAEVAADLVAEGEDLELAEGVGEVAGVPGAADGLQAAVVSNSAVASSRVMPWVCMPTAHSRRAARTRASVRIATSASGSPARKPVSKAASSQ